MAHIKELNGTHCHHHTTVAFVHQSKKDTIWGDLQDGAGVRRGDHFLPTNTPEIHLHVEQLLQNTYWMLAEDLRLPNRKETPHVPGRVADRVLVLQPGVRPVPLRWESRVQDIGPPETTQLIVISNGKSSPRDLHLNAKTQVHATTSKLQCWTSYAKQLARQEHKPTH